MKYTSLCVFLYWGKPPLFCRCEKANGKIIITNAYMCGKNIAHDKKYHVK